MIKTYFVDSFTSAPFKGNPAGFMTVELIADKVLIYGTAVIVMEGNLIG